MSPLYNISIDRITEVKTKSKIELADILLHTNIFFLLCVYKTCFIILEI